MIPTASMTAPLMRETAHIMKVGIISHFLRAQVICCRGLNAHEATINIPRISAAVPVTTCSQTVNDWRIERSPIESKLTEKEGTMTTNIVIVCNTRANAAK